MMVAEENVGADCAASVKARATVIGLKFSRKSRYFFLSNLSIDLSIYINTT